MRKYRTSTDYLTPTRTIRPGSSLPARVLGALPASEAELVERYGDRVRPVLLDLEGDGLAVRLPGRVWGVR